MSCPSEEDLFESFAEEFKEDKRKRRRIAEKKRDKKLRAEKNVKFLAKRVKACRRNYMKRVYGITPIQYRQLCEEQNNKCKICYNVDKLHIDHCHKTKKLRGLICGKCNKGIGLFKENIQTLKTAINYLESFTKSS